MDRGTRIVATLLVIGSAACAANRAPAPAVGTRASTPAEALTSALRRAGVIYWSKEAPCAAWRAEYDASERSWDLVHETVGDGQQVEVRYGYSARGDSASLSGPGRTWREEPKETGWRVVATGAYCTITLRIGAVTDESAVVGDMRWYFDRAACERDRASAVADAADCLSARSTVAAAAYADGPFWRLADWQ